MTQENQGRNRRADRARPDPTAPLTPAKGAPRQPIGRSKELMAREAQLRQGTRTGAGYTYDEPAWQPPQPIRTGTTHRRNSKKHSSHNALWLAVAFLCLLTTAVLILFILPQVTGFTYENLPNYAFVNGALILRDDAAAATHEQYRQAIQTDRIYNGVYIDGIHVGGMTAQQAYDAVNAIPGGEGGQFAITVEIGDESWSINSDTVPLYRNTQDMVMKAWAVGRVNTTAIRGTTTTPFRQRLSTVQDALSNPRIYTTATTYDHGAIRALVNAIAQSVNREPVNATVSTFDPDTKTFTFTYDENGLMVDADEIYAAVTACLDRGDYWGRVSFTPQVVLASVTRTELMNSFGRISSFTTDTTSSANRNTNIRLSCEAITNTMVSPGETFSFNAATGQRTAEKGYKPAAAIAGGETFDEIGGGVCQTSSTLFNAVARANLTITDRDPHAWPSNYVPKGEDATVNWPGLDFKFRNDTEWPIFIVATYANRKCTVEIYGKTLGDGVTIDLESEVTYVKEPPAEAKYVQNTNLPIGTEKETVKARTGYTVVTYKVWYRNGQEFKREKLHTSHYQMYQKTIEWN